MGLEKGDSWPERRIRESECSRVVSRQPGSACSASPSGRLPASRKARLRSSSRTTPPRLSPRATKHRRSACAVSMAGSHAERQVRHDPALRPSGRRSGGVPPEGDSGLVDRPKSLSLDDLKKHGQHRPVAGFECSGNRGPLQGLCGNGRGPACRCKKVLDAAGVKATAREFVFFGADHGEEEVGWRTQKFKIDHPVRPELARARRRCRPSR